MDEKRTDVTTDTVDDGVNTTTTTETRTDEITTTTTPDVSVADAVPGVEPEQATQDVTSTVDPSASSLSASEVAADAGATVPTEGTQTLEGASLEDAPHAVVDDSIGQAQTAAYNEAVSLAPEGAPTGEEPVADVDGTIVPAGAMPANGVWPEQHGVAPESV